ncbi:MFS transporter [Tsukamurella pseudospumae]|uniref:MFS transporter n=1 Tax=Tsukamurella pseudospumae TaxID=239498 RepID=A0A138AVI9_9ACTN|nr:MFS transporter [Tsukamurella pseudospumae]KXP14468.1 MFS transporter [Tsukamurella pseudospumae]
MTENLLPAPGPHRGRIAAVVIVCWLFVVFDGYDLIVYGNVIASLQREWGIGPGEAGTIGSVGLAGMLVGALVAGRLSDAVGRRWAVLGTVVVLSVFTGLCALADGPIVFAALRFCAGLGLGGLVPTSNAMVAEIVPARWRPAAATLNMSGVPLGGCVAAVAGLWIIPEWGWRPMFAIAVLPALVLVPVAVLVLPSDADGRGKNTARAGFGAILRGEWRTPSLLFAAATVATLLAWYGLGTWLPKLMQEAGTDLGGSLRFALALNLGAVLGSLGTAWAGMRFGAVRSGAVAALLAGAGLLALLASPPPAVTVALLVVAGVGTHGTQCLVIAAIATAYPAALRGTALGWALGVGRIGAVAAPQLAGWLLGAGGGPASSFVLFAGAALITALVLGALARRPVGVVGMAPIVV